MSLRAFHVFFISVCILFSAGFAFWGIRSYQLHGSVQAFWLGVGAIPAAILLVAYSGWVRRKFTQLGLFVAIFALLPASAAACPTCFGDPDSELTQGAVKGIVFLLFVVGGVLSTIGYTIWSWSRRAQALAPIESSTRR